MSRVGHLQLFASPRVEVAFLVLAAAGFFTAHVSRLFACNGAADARAIPRLEVSEEETTPQLQDVPCGVGRVHGDLAHLLEPPGAANDMDPALLTTVRVHQLQHISWRDFEDVVVRFSDSNAAKLVSRNGERVTIPLPGRTDAVAAMQVDRLSNQVTLRGPNQLVSDWMRVLQAVDTWPSTPACGFPGDAHQVSLAPAGSEQKATISLASCDLDTGTTKGTTDGQPAGTLPARPDPALQPYSPDSVRAAPAAAELRVLVPVVSFALGFLCSLALVAIVLLSGVRLQGRPFVGEHYGRFRADPRSSPATPADSWTQNDELASDVVAGKQQNRGQDRAILERVFEQNLELRECALTS